MACNFKSTRHSELFRWDNSYDSKVAHYRTFTSNLFFLAICRAFSERLLAMIAAQQAPKEYQEKFAFITDSVNRRMYHASKSLPAQSAAVACDCLREIFW